MNPLRHAARSLRREFLAGDLLTVFAALVLGVAVMTAVGTLVDRVTLALGASAAEAIGGDLGVRGREDPPAAFAEEAGRRGLRSARMVGFPSVLFHGDASQMATVKGVDAGYPLRGQLRVARDANGLAPEAARAPPPGQAYADPRILEALGATVGERIEFGSGHVRIARVLLAEPDASGGLMEMAPALIVNRADIDAAGLLGPGSRASYRLMFAGPGDAIADFRQWLRPQLDGGLRLVSIEDAQQGLRAAFDRAGRFLALAALLAVLLAGVATALAANRFALGRIDTVAVLRCLGARQRDILSALALQLLLLAIPACALGIGIGMLTQMALVEALGNLIPARLPLPQAAPMLSGAGIGLLLLLGFGLPPLLRLRGVPPMRVLNRSFSALPPASLLAYAAALAATVALAVYATGDLPLAAWVLGGLGALALLAAAAGTALLWGLRRVQRRLRGPWKLGLAALTRRRGLAVVQLVGLSLSLCALLLLAVIGPGLLGQWRDRLPADTPNHFLLNVQRDQAEAVDRTLRGLGVAEPDLQPFGTGRLLAINGRPPQHRQRDTDDDDDANRPVNFSWRHTFPPANALTAGRFWEPGSAAAEASVEEGWAQRYGLALGDTVTLQLGEQERSFTVTSLRKADWDSFRVNFFLLLNAGAVGDAPYNLISAFHLPSGRTALLAPLAREFPNVSVLEIDAILQRVREVIERVSQAVQLVMGFSLAAGVLVLLAALQATAGERRYDSAVLRTLGARHGQLRGAVLVEFGALGLLAAILAVAAAAIIGVVVSRQLFELALVPPWPALLAGGAGGVALSVLAGWSGSRRILRTPPALALRAFL
ncbi:oxidoreductase [Pseudoxanthomonas broegbernensis]|uniref:Oxidoreductase n=1 Tax=Pseudoxanthomonas broegbernensis TaxID=83619 RepID=A0A7V8GKD8_9GAMM|nr:FtsX-like permease family protein [Pseudoxanthomonas broegbernensis]KAF1685026.1 oxidoreductase [Pseudoxanthomonas broegbernensis]MBB6066365.1 putative ABC transport system permease protein [Pseudoxanthomonas broegbernensis]